MKSMPFTGGEFTFYKEIIYIYFNFYCKYNAQMKLKSKTCKKFIYFNYLITFILFVHCVCKYMCVWGTTGDRHCFSSTLWVLKMKFKLSGLLTSAFNF